MRLGMGLVATMTALLLGLVTASARSSFDGQDTAAADERVEHPDARPAARPVWPGNQADTGPHSTGGRVPDRDDLAR